MIVGNHIAVWFSCGAASAVAAKLTLESYGQTNKISIVNNPIKEEHEDNRRFLKDVESWLGHTIEFATRRKYPNKSCEEVWSDRRFMSGPKGAPCTLELKKMARQEWEEVNNPDYTVLGFTSEEKKRADRFRLTERETLLTPLIDADLTKQDCFDLLQSAGIKLPQIYSLGFPNANCIGCVKATSPTYWNLVRKEFPEVFASREKQSSEIGAKLARYKGKRVYLKDLPEDAKGASLKSYNFECGIFCEEPKAPEYERVWHG
jgi:3'-phosphoadenosine 5'-phosphosulfate sulfotransferase (PAPS reductase)/FAD synthetase